MAGKDVMSDSPQQAVIDFLADPASHSGTAVKRIDTHAASVFLAGDRVLKFVGTLLAKISDDKCHVARHGGEEFVMLFRGFTVAEAAKVVDDTRADLAERNLVDRKTGERMDHVTFSGGVADVFAFEEPRDALKAADRALYLAKEHGRNRVYIASDATEG